MPDEAANLFLYERLAVAFRVSGETVGGTLELIDMQFEFISSPIVIVAIVNHAVDEADQLVRSVSSVSGSSVDFKQSRNIAS